MALRSYNHRMRFSRNPEIAKKAKELKEKTNYEAEDIRKTTNLLNEKIIYLRTPVSQRMGGELAVAENPVYKFLKKRLFDIGKQTEGHAIKVEDVKIVNAIITDISELETRTMKKKKYMNYIEELKEKLPNLISKETKPSQFNPKAFQRGHYFTKGYEDSRMLAIERKFALIGNGINRRLKQLETNRKNHTKKLIDLKKMIKTIPKAKPAYVDIEREIKTFESEVKKIDKEIKMRLEKKTAMEKNKDAELKEIEARLASEGKGVFRTVKEEMHYEEAAKVAEQDDETLRLSARMFLDMSIDWWYNKDYKKGNAAAFRYGFKGVEDLLRKPIKGRVPDTIIISPRFFKERRNDFYKLQKLTFEQQKFEPNVRINIIVLQPETIEEAERFKILDTAFNGVLAYSREK